MIPLGALAFPVCIPAAAETRAVGEATADWIAAQKSEEQTVAEERPLAGEAAQRSYERYLRSFENEIPERFDPAEQRN